MDFYLKSKPQKHHQQQNILKSMPKINQVYLDEQYF